MLRSAPRVTAGRCEPVALRLEGPPLPYAHVCRSNQDVLDRATAVVLAVPPPAARTVLAELSFGPHHVVMSAVAGLRLHELHDSAAPAVFGDHAFDFAAIRRR